MRSYTLAINMAMTLDGKVMRPDGKWYGLSSRKDKERMDVYRSQAEVLIVGKNSIQNDNPVIHLRYSEGESPRPIVLIRKGSLDAKKRIFQSQVKPLVFCTNENRDLLNSELGSVAFIETLGDTLEPDIVLDRLLDLGYSKILLEGGPTLNYSFFLKNLINRIHLTIVPYIIGAKDLMGIVNGREAFFEFDKSKWILESVEKIYEEVYLTYQKKDS